MRPLATALLLAFSAGLLHADDEKIAKALEKAGAKVTRDQKLPGKPVVYVLMPFASTTKAEDWKRLKALPRLTGLSLVGTKIDDKGLQSLKNVPNLTDLQLAGVLITDVGMKYLKVLKKLQTLGLHKTRVTGSGLAGLTSLKKIHLQAARVTDAGLSGLKGLTNLQELDLRSNPVVTDAGMKHLKGLKNLRDLQVGHTKVTAAGAKELQRALPRCKITR